jgi:hypothetical protein
MFDGILVASIPQMRLQFERETQVCNHETTKYSSAPNNNANDGHASRLRSLGRAHD